MSKTGWDDTLYKFGYSIFCKIEKRNETDDTTYSSEEDNHLCKLCEVNEEDPINVNIDVNMNVNNVNETVVERENDSHSDPLCGICKVKIHEKKTLIPKGVGTICDKEFSTKTRTVCLLWCWYENDPRWISV